MHKSKIIFMGTPDIASNYLQSLINNKYNIIAVYSQPPRKSGRGMIIKNSPVHNLAIQNNISVFNPIDFNSKKTVSTFFHLQPDIVIVMGYGLLIPKEMLKIPIHGFINIHVSLLPKWRGAAPIEHAILNGDKKTGVSIFQLEDKLDSGPIISKSEIDIDKNINKEKLTSKLNIIGNELLIKTLPKILDNNISYTKQKNIIATYAKKITSNDRRINFYNNIEKVYNHIRAFSPIPSAWFILNNERIKIISCSIEICNTHPSIILNDNFHIGCEGGKIIPKIMQREGKKPMAIDEFIRGFSFKINQKLNA